MHEISTQMAQNEAYFKEKNTNYVFLQGALFRGKGSPPVLEEPARHRPRQGRGFVRPPVT